MSGPVKFLRARLRNAWMWPGIYQIGCWWEKRYRPERWEPWIEGGVILPSGRSTRRRPGETLPEMVDRLGREDREERE